MEEQNIYNGKAVEESTITAKCTSCGAKMEFVPDKQKLKCPYCGFEKDIEVAGSTEQTFSDIASNMNNEWGDETHIYKCNNCGSKQLLSRNEISASCPFCGTTNVVETKELSGLKPNAVVPFAVKKDKARENAVEWASKKFFAPTAFKKNVNAQGLNGIYSPAYTYDTNTTSTYYGRLGKHYTETVHVNGKTETRTRVRYFYVSGNHTMSFDDILIQATKKITQRDLDKMSPFETNDSKKYDESYLFGYSAEASEESCQSCWQKAKDVASKAIKKSILSRYDYDEIASFDVSTTYSDITYKYVLLPIYVGHYSWNEKTYNFFVNGHNGKVTGKTPVSAIKVTLFTLGIIAIVGLIVLLFLTQSGG